MKTLNLTKPRKVILNVVRHTDKHPTAADILKLLDQHGHQFAYATIYNSLRYLTEHGLIRELNLGDGVTRYDGRTEPHQHMVCQRCGAVSETSQTLPDSFMEHIESETGFQIHDLDIQFSGVCSDCRHTFGTPQ